MPESFLLVCQTFWKIPGLEFSHKSATPQGQDLPKQHRQIPNQEMGLLCLHYFFFTAEQELRGRPRTEGAMHVHERAHGCRKQRAIQQKQNVGHIRHCKCSSSYFEQSKKEEGENNISNILIYDNTLFNPEKQGEINFNNFNSVLFNPIYKNIISSCNRHEKLLMRYFTFCFCTESLKYRVYLTQHNSIHTIHISSAQELHMASDYRGQCRSKS